MSFSFSSQNKLKSKADIDLVFSKGSFLKVPGFSLVYRAQDTKGSCGVRVGFSIGKKVQPRAVDRNKTKRIMRESFRLLFPKKLSLSSVNYDFMIVCNEKVVPSFALVSDKIKSLLLSFAEIVKND
jgi:ribonuclease P protein component